MKFLHFMTLCWFIAGIVTQPAQAEDKFRIKSFTVTPVEIDGNEHLLVFNVRYDGFAKTRGLLVIRALTPKIRFAEMFQGSNTMTQDQPVDGEKRNTLVKCVIAPKGAKMVFEAELTDTGQKILATCLGEKDADDSKARPTKR